LAIASDSDLLGDTDAGTKEELSVNPEPKTGLKTSRENKTLS